MAGKSSFKWIYAGVVALVLLVIVAYGIYAFGQNDTEKSKYTFRASVTNDCTGTPWFVGSQQDFFKKQGIDYIDVGQTVATQRPYALALGQIDVLDADPLTLVNLLKSGAKVKAVAQSGISPGNGDTKQQYLSWIVANDSDLTSFESIKYINRTLKVGVGALGCSSDLQTNALLRKYGIPADKIEYSVIPEENQQQALRENIIDIAVLQPAFSGCTKKRLNARSIASSSDALGEAGGMTLLICKESYIQSHPETVEKFITGYKESERWCNENPLEAGNITAERLGLCDGGAVSHYYSNKGNVNESQLQVWLDEMTTQGLIKPGEFKVSDLYTDQFKKAW
jgi:ABC-type nitrate/sulfonate/bicarbonate transport system substrate-binding protein